MFGWEEGFSLFFNFEPSNSIRWGIAGLNVMAPNAIYANLVVISTVATACLHLLLLRVTPLLLMYGLAEKHVISYLPISLELRALRFFFSLRYSPYNLWRIPPIEYTVEWTGWDLNPRPSACQADVHTSELPALKIEIPNWLLSFYRLEKRDFYLFQL